MNTADGHGTSSRRASVPGGSGLRGVGSFTAVTDPTREVYAFKPLAMFRCAVTVGTSPVANVFRAGTSPVAA
jgi:hypothetical protein